jgi:uncharacterized protein YuzE
LRITYDPTADAVFIQLVPKIGFGEAKRGRVCGEVPNATFSLDADDKILGIEILAASACLPPEAIEWLRESAEVLGPPRPYGSPTGLHDAE